MRCVTVLTNYHDCQKLMSSFAWTSRGSRGRKIGSSPLKGCGGNCRPGGK